MKFLTYILAFTVIFLSVKPGIDAIPFIAENQKSCCSISNCSPVSNNQNTGDNEDNQGNGICNPFQACGTCLLICISTPFYPTFKTDVLTKQFIGYQSFIASQFISEFWQPPQFV